MKMERIVGWVATKPCVGFTLNEVECCTFKLGVKRSDGNVEYHNVAAGGPGAAICGRRLRKGLYLAVDGWFWQKPNTGPNKRRYNRRFLIAEQICQLANSRGDIAAGLFYNGILPPDVGWYTVGDGPFDTNQQVEFAFAAGGR